MGENEEKKYEENKVKCQLLARVPNIGQFFNTPHHRDKTCISTVTYDIV